MGTFTIDDKQFLLDGAPFRILSGALHYFRVRPEQWGDRLRKLRAMGLNTVETYVAWNLHEPRPGEFDFSGGLDLVAFLEQAAALGLRAIVRPGPYICAEWEMGGLPAWLLADPGMRLRCMHPPYLAAVDRYLDALLPRLAPLQIGRGGPIIAVQVENEYGSYGDDREYLRHLAEGTRARGIDCLLFTSDGPEDAMLQSGTLPELLKTANFGSRATAAFAKLREYQPRGPLMCMEFWNGWFDRWGAPHHTRPAEDAAAALDEILAAGASVNLYMFHGGTNFGFMNGANCYIGQAYEPTITSYDYDSPLSEAGDLTPKFHAFRAVIGKYAPLPDEPLPESAPKLALGPIALTESAGLFEALGALSAPRRLAAPEPMEHFGQSYGFFLYRTKVSGPRPPAPLTIIGLRDRAQVFVNGREIGVLERATPDPSITIEVPPGGATIDLLVENMGRVNYGPNLADRKGIAGGVALGQQQLFGWEIFPLPLDDLGGLQFAAAEHAEGPSFFRGAFELAEPRDTFLALPGWTKGVAWVNGFNLGRYWSAGPQRTLYVPAPILKAGANEIVVLELHQAAQPATAELRDTPDLGPAE
jgi:beta-galactosidase